ncbi:CPBP family intramembrane metalloprotease domain-containing protein, partial [Bacillus cereus]
MILHAKSFHNKDKIQRAKIGLQLFLSILIITSIILNVVVIITKSMPLIVVYMFTPALSSILTRIILKEGFKDVSFSLGN